MEELIKRMENDKIPEFVVLRMWYTDLDVYRDDPFFIGRREIAIRGFLYGLKAVKYITPDEFMYYLSELS